MRSVLVQYRLQFRSFSSSFYLVNLYDILSENTPMQMESRLWKDESGIPTEYVHKTVTPTLAADSNPVSSVLSDFRPVLCGRKQPLETGSLQQVLRLLFQVGGELVGPLSVRERFYTALLCSDTYCTASPSLTLTNFYCCVPAAEKAQRQTTKAATLQLNIM